MTDPLEETLNAVLVDVSIGARFRAELHPDEPLPIACSLAFILGMGLAVYHPEYVRMLATRFRDPEHVKRIADTIVAGNPIERVEVEPARREEAKK